MLVLGLVLGLCRAIAIRVMVRVGVGVRVRVIYNFGERGSVGIELLGVGVGFCSRGALDLCRGWMPPMRLVYEGTCTQSMKGSRKMISGRRTRGDPWTRETWLGSS